MLLSKYINTVPDYIEVSQIVPLSGVRGGTTSSLQQYGPGLTFINTNTLSNPQNVTGVSLSNNNLTIPAGRYVYKFHINIQSTTLDHTRSNLLGLSSLSNQSMIVPFTFGTNIDGYGSYISTWFNEGEFTITTSQTVRMVLASNNATAINTNNRIGGFGYYLADDNSRWSSVISVNNVNLRHEAATLNLWRLQPL